MNFNNNDNAPLSKEAQMQQVAGELIGLRKVLAYLYDENPEAFKILLYIKQTYKQWPDMIRWLKHNQLYGQRLVEFFQNESPDGGGYLMGCLTILSRLKGNKHRIDNIKADELL